MKCPNCNSDINEGSIICPVCNTQFAFSASDNYINLPDDDFVIKSSGVEEYVDPNGSNNTQVNNQVGVLDLKTNQPPKKVIKKVVTVQTQQAPEESVEITPTVNFDKNDEVINEEPTELEKTVVNVGGFTNTIIDASSATEAPAQETTVDTSNTSNSDLTSPVSLGQPQVNTGGNSNNVMIANVENPTNTIGQVTVTENKEEKPRKKINETMMIAFIMGLIVMLLCLIVYILVNNNKNRANEPVTTTTMTTFNCDDGRCASTTTETTTTTEATTTTEKKHNQGLRSTINTPLSIGQVSICSLYDSTSNKDVLVDVKLDKIYTPQEAEKYMQSINNTTYKEGLSVGVLEYTVTGNELEDGVEISPVTSIKFYPQQISSNFKMDGEQYVVGFNSTTEEKLTNKKSVTVTGYYNYPSDQPVKHLCIGDYDGQKACFKLD